MKPNTPRLAVWTDAYYASFNIQQVGKPAAPMVVAYDRSHMLLGQTALGPVSRQPAARTNFLPADFDGTSAAFGRTGFLRGSGRIHLPESLAIPCGLRQPKQLNLYPHRDIAVLGVQCRVLA